MRIATPFLSRQYSSHLSDFIDILQPKETYLHVRDRTRVSNEIIGSHESRIRIVRPKAAKKAFHAKLIMLEYAKQALLYVGSANFTQQGFFLSHPKKGNVENGLILMVSDKKDLIEWFTKGWEKPVDLDTWNSSATDTPKEDIPAQSYAWGERIADNHIEVYVFLSNPKTVHKARIEGKKTKFKKINTHLFRSEVISTKDIITIYLQDEDDIKFHVFDPTLFENAKRDDGESLFSIDNRILDETIREEVLKAELSKRGIKISSRGVTIVEPPLLEQFYYNAKHLIKMIQRKTYFDESHLRELKAELAMQHGASGAYLTMHLYKIFKQKGLDDFSFACNNRLDDLFESLSCHTDKYMSFLNQWINNAQT